MDSLDPRSALSPRSHFACECVCVRKLLLRVYRQSTAAVTPLWRLSLAAATDTPRPSWSSKCDFLNTCFRAFPQLTKRSKDKFGSAAFFLLFIYPLGVESICAYYCVITVLLYFRRFGFLLTATVLENHFPSTVYCCHDHEWSMNKIKK